MQLNPTFSIEAIKAAAGSKRALVAYSLMLLSWTIIAFRVQRNKNLLKNIEKLPEKDRLEALRLETNARPKSTSPEQWLRSRIHTYYFVAALCMIAGAVVLLWLVINRKPQNIQSGQGPTVKEFTDVLSKKAAQDELNKLRLLAVDESKQFVVARFGEPNARDDIPGDNKSALRDKFAWFSYDLDYYHMDIVFYEEKVYSFTIILTNPELTLALPGLGNSELGSATFADFDDSAEYVDKHSTAWGYVEQFTSNEEAVAPTVSVGYSAVGASYVKYDALSKNPLEAYVVPCSDGTADRRLCEGQTHDSPSMTKSWTHDVNIGLTGDKTPPELSYFREKVRPNVYHVQAGSLFARKDKPPPDTVYFVGLGNTSSTLADYLWSLALNAGTGCHPRCPQIDD